MPPTLTKRRAASFLCWLILVPGLGSARLGLAAGAATAPLSPTLAAKHPGDIGMAGDSSVVFYEDFSEGRVAAVLTRYDSYVNRNGMALVADHPANSPSRNAMRFTSGGDHPATHLYKSFGQGFDELYFRYYAKYIGTGPWHHSGVWIGGYDPPLPFPNPRAGLRPSGDDWYSLGLEPIPSLPHTPMDLYTYWRGMHSWRAAPTGRRYDYFGNTLLQDPGFRMRSGAWVCYEIHLKLNPDPSTGAGAVLEVWQNDRLVRRFDDRGPLGYWVRDKFCPADTHATECTQYRPAGPKLILLDQRWRTTPSLRINYLWPQNYNTAATDSSLLLADMVVATHRIGCIAPPRVPAAAP